MAGGKGSRMKADREKLLLQHEKPIIMHVVDALVDSGCFEIIRAAVSPNSPKTRDYLLENNIGVVMTSGLGYSEDLTQVLQSIDDDVLVASGDLAFLDGDIVQQMASKYDPGKTWSSFVTTRKFVESLGTSSESLPVVAGLDYIYTGISLVNARNIRDGDPVAEDHIILDDVRIAFNLNTRRDYELLGTAGDLAVDPC